MFPQIRFFFCTKASQNLHYKRACRWCEVHPSPSIWQHIATAPCTSLQCDVCRWRAAAEGSARRHGGPERSAGSWGLQQQSSPGTPLMSSTTASNMSSRSSTTSHTRRQSKQESRSTYRHTHAAQLQHGAMTWHTQRMAICMFTHTDTVWG